MNRRSGWLAVAGAVAVVGLAFGAVLLSSPATPGLPAPTTAAVASSGVDGVARKPVRSDVPAPTPRAASPTPSASSAPDPTTRGILAISAGQYQNCAIRSDGTLACWPENMAGEQPTGTFRAVSAGEYSCAIRTAGTLACWPDDPEAFPVSPPPGTFTAVSVSTFRGCAIRTDQTLACWSDEGSDPGTPGGTFTSVSVGEIDSCAIRTDGTLACWGPTASTTPPGTYSAVGARDGSSCAIRTDRTLACWGDDATDPPAGRFTALSLGPHHGCAIRDDQTLACWTSPGFDADADMSPPSGTYSAVASGDTHSCAVGTDGRPACWGGAEPAEVAPGPAVTIDEADWRGGTELHLRWGASPLLAPVTSYDVRYARIRGHRAGPGPWVAWRTGTTSVTGTFRARPALGYCFSVRAHDADGLVSPWRWSCTGSPLDDRALGRSGDWAGVTGPRFFEGSALRTSSFGARITYGGDLRYAVGLITTTCPRCGKIKVYVDSQLWDTVDLSSPTKVDRKLVWVAVEPEDGGLYGQLEIKVVSRGKPVIIDGLVLKVW